MVETSFTPPVSPLHKKSPVDNTNEEAQEALDTIQRLSKEATLRDTGKFFHHMHSTLEHAILYRKGTASVTRLDAPAVHSSMLWPLMLMAVGFTLFYVTILILRVRSEIAAAKIHNIQLAEARG